MVEVFKIYWMITRDMEIMMCENLKDDPEQPITKPDFSYRPSAV